jgi:hypothetical protein
MDVVDGASIPSNVVGDAMDVDDIVNDVVNVDDDTGNMNLSAAEAAVAAAGGAFVDDVVNVNDGTVKVKAVSPMDVDANAAADAAATATTAATATASAATAATAAVNAVVEGVVDADFGGMLANEVVCAVCHARSVKREPFTELSLSFQVRLVVLCCFSTLPSLLEEVVIHGVVALFSGTSGSFMLF